MSALMRLKKWGFLKRRRLEALVFLILFLSFFGYIGSVMGVGNMLNTIMKTSRTEDLGSFSLCSYSWLLCSEL